METPAPISFEETPEAMMYRAVAPGCGGTRAVEPGCGTRQAMEYPLPSPEEEAEAWLFSTGGDEPVLRLPNPVTPQGEVLRPTDHGALFCKKVRMGRHKQVMINMHYLLGIEKPENVPELLKQAMALYPKFNNKEPKLTVAQQCKRCAPEIVRYYPRAPQWGLALRMPPMERQIYNDAFEDAMQTLWTAPLIIDDWSVNPTMSTETETNRVHCYFAEVLIGALDQATRLRVSNSCPRLWTHSPVCRELFASLYFAVVTDAFLTFILVKRREFVWPNTLQRIAPMLDNKYIVQRKMNLLSSTFGDLLAICVLPSCVHLMPNFPAIEKMVNESTENNK